MVILPVLAGLFHMQFLTPVLLLGFVFGLLCLLIRRCKR